MYQNKIFEVFFWKKKSIIFFSREIPEIINNNKMRHVAMPSSVFWKQNKQFDPFPPFVNYYIHSPLIRIFTRIIFKKALFWLLREKNETSSYIYIGVIFLFLIFKKITNLIHFPLLKSWLYSAVDDISRFSNFAIKFCEEIKNYQDKNPPLYNSIVLLLLL